MFSNYIGLQITFMHVYFNCYSRVMFVDMLLPVVKYGDILAINLVLLILKEYFFNKATEKSRTIPFYRIVVVYCRLT